MSIAQLIFLTFWCVFFTVFTYQKISKSKVKVFDIAWWVFFSILLFFIIIFNGTVTSLLAYFFAVPVNAVFTLFIGFSIFIIFLQNLKLSKLQTQLNELAQSLALLEKKIRDNSKDNNA